MTHTKPWTPNEGHSVKLTCNVRDGRPRNITTVTWKKGDTTLHTTSRYTLSDYHTVLDINSLNHTLDDGHYSCAARNEAGMGHFSAKLHLLVNCK